MDNLLTIAFEARNSEMNHHRRYQVTVGRDLLNDWTVAISYGRIGQSGQELRYAATEPNELQVIVRDRLRRRLSAPRRIGCRYRMTLLNAVPGFDIPAWLPGNLMGGFFSSQASEPIR
jgi:predicted DNA-binding WGR domain protein